MKHHRPTTPASLISLYLLLFVTVSLASFFGARGLVFWLGPKVEAQILVLGGR